jgi:hypothetical protein
LINADLSTVLASDSEVLVFLGMICNSWVPAPIAVIMVKKPTIERSFANSPCMLLDNRPRKSSTYILNPPGDADINKYIRLSRRFCFCDSIGGIGSEIRGFLLAGAKTWFSVKLVFLLQLNFFVFSFDFYLDFTRFLECR